MLLISGGNLLTIVEKDVVIEFFTMIARVPGLQEQARAQRVASVYKHTWTLAISHPIAAALLAASFWEVASHGLLLLWLASLVLVSLARVPLYFAYLREADDLSRSGVWRRNFALMAALQGTLYGVAWFAFIPAGDPIYLPVVSMWVMGLSACAVVGYAADPKTLLAFFLPTVLPGIGFLLLEGTQQSHILAMALFVYGVVILLAFLPVHRSIAHSIELNVKLRALSQQDGLTGLANRRHFDESLEKELSRAMRQQQPLSLLLLDIDHFKIYNDHYGHVAGDHCLRLISDVIANCARRSGEVIARYGGEEFALLLPNTNGEQLREMAERLHQAIHQSAIPHEGRRDGVTTITASIGGTTVESIYPPNPECIIEDADTALYAAKHHGRNQSRFFCRKSRQLEAVESA